MPRREDGTIGRSTATGRGRRAASAGFAACAAAGAIFAVPALGAQDPANGVGIRDGNHILAVHNIDFVGAFGDYAPGETLTIEVFRGAHRIARAAGPATPGVEGMRGGLEANHGPEGAPQPGDCWDTVTPDIRPGDRIVVTDSTGGQDSTYVDEITIDGIADDRASDDVLVTGVARHAVTGAPLPAEQLDSGAWRSSSNGTTRGGGPEIAVDAGGNYTARYAARNNWGLERGGPVDQREVLDAAHEFGYGHVAVLPPEIQLVDGAIGAFDTPGPALGCEGSPTAGPNAITTSDDKLVNRLSGDLALGGVATADTTAVSVTLSDGTTSIDGVVAGPGRSGLANEGQKGWTATFSRADLETLAPQGTLTATATFAGGTPGTATRTIAKDTIAPGDATATPGPGTYVGEQFVSLRTADSTDVVRYTTDGSTPNATSRRAAGQIRIANSTVVKALVTDAVGNPRVGGVQEFAYTITQRQPASQPAVQQSASQPPAASGDAPPAASGSVVDPVIGSPDDRLALRTFVTNPRVSVRRARSQGIRLVMRLQEGTQVVRIQVLRRLTGGRRKLIASGFRAPERAGLYRTRLNHRSLRRLLKPGRYVVEATPGAARTDLGKTSKYNFTVTR